jgi:ATP-dependent Clp protease ATP-binding subunit ClpB
VQNSPYSVVLFDEFEKADPAVGNTLLSVFDEGSMLDARGTRINFRNTVIVLTSNLGAHHLADLPVDAPADAARAQVMAEVRRYFSPELLNRIDEVVLFRRLPLELMEPIVRNEVRRIEESLHDSHPELQLNVSNEAVEWLAKSSYDPAYGARPVRRTVHRALLGPLARMLVEQEPTSMKIIADIGLPNSSELSVKFD